MLDFSKLKLFKRSPTFLTLSITDKHNKNVKKFFSYVWPHNFRNSEIAYFRLHWRRDPCIVSTASKESWGRYRGFINIYIYIYTHTHTHTHTHTPIMYACDVLKTLYKYLSYKTYDTNLLPYVQYTIIWRSGICAFPRTRLKIKGRGNQSLPASKWCHTHLYLIDLQTQISVIFKAVNYTKRLRKRKAKA